MNPAHDDRQPPPAVSSGQDLCSVVSATPPAAQHVAPKLTPATGDPPVGLPTAPVTTKASAAAPNRTREKFTAANLELLARSANDRLIYNVKRGSIGESWKSLGDELRTKGLQHSDTTFRRKLEDLLKWHSDDADTPAALRHIMDGSSQAITISAILDSLADAKEDNTNKTDAEHEKGRAKIEQDRIGGEAIRAASLVASRCHRQLSLTPTDDEDTTKLVDHHAHSADATLSSLKKHSSLTPPSKDPSAPNPIAAPTNTSQAGTSPSVTPLPMTSLSTKQSSPEGHTLSDATNQTPRSSNPVQPATTNDENQDPQVSKTSTVARAEDVKGGGRASSTFDRAANKILGIPEDEAADRGASSSQSASSQTKKRARKDSEVGAESQPGRKSKWMRKDGNEDLLALMQTDIEERRTFQGMMLEEIKKGNDCYAEQAAKTAAFQAGFLELLAKKL
ncbi:hypothetical protein JAAARDRAFT_190867 [Jaapia argillacea MUCL 33604]|uniref:Myb/SANT-like domain-containing protein n=1 Tax=Jaapia argillacea MUCL 33604 TaxID=933084 RepID=A0A067PQJ6_9AGAM|nr:hypothetical protein JAAARDRAFT_197386 [Jaapia argillacea MUCL 33604]KDQ60713.1 hypothetical protein JAAARDRAFT_190867 [Jaapia argillacea MUCL 33604]